MVFQKRLDSGYIGYQIPNMPRFPRSARGKRSLPKKVEVNQMSPFDLLATVAGELLTKRDSNCSLYGLAETSIPGNKIEQVQLDNGSPSKSDIFDQGSSQENNFVARFVSHGQASFDFEEHLRSPAEKTAASALALVKCDVSDKDAFVGSLKKNVVGFHKFDDPMDFDTKATAPVSSDSCVEIIPIGDSHSAGRSSFPSVGDGIELLVDRDDAENYSGRIHSSELYAMAFKRHCIGDSRVRKILTSNYWKADRKALNDGELLNNGEEIKPVFRSRMMCYTRQRTKRSSLKRRKLSERCSFSACNGGSCNHDVPDPLVNDDIKLDSFDTHADINGAHGRSCSMGGDSSSYESDNHVKLSIKSFRVPELFIEIPANATVGSLKRTVMDAVTSILGGGLRVGVLHQGKKIRDDNKTILQAGISNADKSDNLGFTLEPNPTEATEPPNSLFHESEPVTKFNASAAPTLDQGTYNAHSPTANCTDGELDSVHSASNPSSSIDRLNDNSKALVPIFGVNPEAFSIVPLNNSKRSEMVQRRIRRPFSVLEVEALVLAVEKLGTGRWRDVKHRAFDNAKHRTYVDLKDKWKTLVHTARISPQQRRGEPVPQELLDRVLSAHDYWSRQQVKSTVLSEQCLHSSEFNACPLGGCHRFDRV